MTDTLQPPHKFSCTWEQADKLWPRLNVRGEGRITRVFASDAELLLVAAVLPDVGEGLWRTSIFLDDRHLGHENVSWEEAIQYAEQTLSGYLQERALTFLTSVPSFDNAFHEIVAQLAFLLENNWQLSHISTYPGVWVAVCCNNSQDELEEFAFSRDSFGEIRQLDRKDYCGWHMLEASPLHISA